MLNKIILILILSFIIFHAESLKCYQGKSGTGKVLTTCPAGTTSCSKRIENKITYYECSNNCLNYNFANVIQKCCNTDGCNKAIKKNLNLILQIFVFTTDLTSGFLKSTCQIGTEIKQTNNPI
ncbi:hypothetical protein BpHYR1_022164 [Brachionus plicatilis]|uniref:Uncharacterized protein n=1 Tax=Brachionus plicatilis TaxID=10195 RepID=A0A3M7QKJ5_BRAPC|nr:hypothetical protein BpHYR1_022164 [Brachionus plicatilis]